MQFRRLPIKLTIAEVADIGRDAAKLSAEIDLLTLQRKAAADAAKETIDKKQGELSGMLAQINEGTKEADVPCHVEIDWTTGKAIIVRDDTGEVVERREVSPQERQTNLGDVLTRVRPVDDAPPPPPDDTPCLGDPAPVSWWRAVPLTEEQDRAGIASAIECASCFHGLALDEGDEIPAACPGCGATEVPKPAKKGRKKNGEARGEP